jgi:WD40 repeat protein
VEIFSAGNASTLEVLQEQTGRGVEARWSPNGRTVVWGRKAHLHFSDGTLLEFEAPAEVERIRWSPDGKWIVVSGGERLTLVDAEKRAIVCTTERVGSVVTLAWARDSTRVAFGVWTLHGQVQLWDVRTPDVSPVAIPMGHRDGVWTVAWSKGDEYLASGSNDGTARAVRIEGTTAVGLVTRVEHRSAVGIVAWAHHAPLLASGSGDRLVKVTHAGGAPQFELAGHTETVRTVAWSHDGRFMATGGDDNTARLWSVATREMIALLDAHENDVTGVAFSSDDRFLLTFGEDGAVMVHPRATEDVVAKVGETTLRTEMTAEEWQRHMPESTARRPSWPQGD